MELNNLHLNHSHLFQAILVQLLAPLELHSLLHNLENEFKLYNKFITCTNKYLTKVDKMKERTLKYGSILQNHINSIDDIVYAYGINNNNQNTHL